MWWFRSCSTTISNGRLVGERWESVSCGSHGEDGERQGFGRYGCFIFRTCSSFLTFIFLEVLKKTLYGNFAHHYRYSCYSCILFDNITSSYNCWWSSWFCNNSNWVFLSRHRRKCSEFCKLAVPERVLLICGSIFWC
jgi:hypothetical protein